MSSSRTLDRLTALRRRCRRLVVVQTFLGYPLLILGYALFVASGRMPLILWAPIALALMALSVSGVLIIHAWAGPRTDIRSALDERQRFVLHRAHARAFGILLVLLVLAVAALALAASIDGPLEIGMETLTPVLIEVGVFVPLLPAAILAWFEPDPDGDPDRGH